MLEAWAQELPTKYGMSFIQFLAQQVQEQNPKEETEYQMGTQIDSPNL
jgi:hypothetical protein